MLVSIVLCLDRGRRVQGAVSINEDAAEDEVVVARSSGGQCSIEMSDDDRRVYGIVSKSQIVCC